MCLIASIQCELIRWREYVSAAYEIPLKWKRSDWKLQITNVSIMLRPYPDSRHNQIYTIIKVKDEEVEQSKAMNLNKSWLTFDSGKHIALIEIALMALRECIIKLAKIERTKNEIKKRKRNQISSEKKKKKNGRKQSNLRNSKQCLHFFSLCDLNRWKKSKIVYTSLVSVFSL